MGGLGSGLLATVLEITIFPKAELSLGLLPVLLGTIAPAFMVAGVLLGLTLLGARWTARRLSRLFRADPSRSEPLLSAALLAVASSPGLLALARQLAHGRHAAHLLGSSLVRLGLVAAGGLLLLALLWLGFRLAQRIDASSRRRLPLSVGLTLWALAELLFHADAELYERLYLYLHHLLMAGYLLAGLLGTLALWRGFFPARLDAPRPPRRRLRLILTTAVLVTALSGAFVSRRVLISDQHLRYCALELAVVSAKLLLLLPLEVPSEAPVFLQASTTQHTARKGALEIRDANVIMVSIDALRPDHLGTYGYTRKTSPNIDALAARSVRFANAYCQVPLTCYSVPSLHTGDYVRSTLPFLPKPPPTLARLLSGRGYTTAAFYNSSLFFCDDERATAYGKSRFGFDYSETPHREAEALTDQVLAYLQSFHSSGKRKLFLWVHYFDVHEPYKPHAQFPFGPDSMDRYDAEIAYVDQSIGRLVAAVAELPGPTIFVLTSDHGEEFKEHGGFYHGSSLYEEQVRVPLIIGVPGVKGRVVTTPAQLVDVVPTLLALLGQRRPESVHGRSLVPMILGEEQPDRTAFVEVHTKKAVRWGDWKFIEDYRRGTQELYDLRSDPRERQNLASRRRAEADRMRGLLQRWFNQISAVAAKVEKDRPEAIDLGLMGDRRALPLLSQLLLDVHAAPRWRREAARLIGQLQDRDAADALWQAVGDDDKQVGSEAAIALGEIKDVRARVVLPQVMEDADPDTHLRASIALGRVDSPEATSGLIQALWSSSWETQNRAAHYLGFVGDKRALAALLRAAPLAHMRPRLGLALGRIGLRLHDKTVMPVLLDWVRNDSHLETRLRALAGLSFLGDKRAVRPLAKLLAEEPDLLWLPEALSRLGGIGKEVPGVDFSPARRGLSKEGWGECLNNASVLTDDFHESSWCTMVAHQASLQVNLPRRPSNTEVQVRLRALESVLKDQPLMLVINGHPLPAIALQGNWQTVRMLTDTRIWRQGRNQIRFSLGLPLGPDVLDTGFIALDYLLLIPRGNE